MATVCTLQICLSTPLTFRSIGFRAVSASMGSDARSGSAWEACELVVAGTSAAVAAAFTAGGGDVNLGAMLCLVAFIALTAYRGHENATLQQNTVYLQVAQFLPQAYLCSAIMKGRAASHRDYGTQRI